MTLHPVRVVSSNWSTSKATTAPSTACAIREEPEVRSTTEESWSRAKLTGSTAGKAPSV
jgi:hypothetical protein